MELVEGIRQLIERGLMGAAVIAGALAGFAGFLFLLYRLIKCMRPKEVRQAEQKILSHRFYPLSGRGRIAYLILCLEQTLQCCGQDLTAWEWILRKLWSITDDSQSSWIDAWLDCVGELLPSAVLRNDKSAENAQAKILYEQTGAAMIVINTILDCAYTIVCEWSPDTAAHDPDALGNLDRAEAAMEEFGISLPSNESIQALLSEQKSSSFGKPFDGLRYSVLSQGKNA